MLQTKANTFSLIMKVLTFNSCHALKYVKTIQGLESPRTPHLESLHKESPDPQMNDRRNGWQGLGLGDPCKAKEWPERAKGTPQEYRALLDSTSGSPCYGGPIVVGGSPCYGGPPVPNMGGSPCYGGPPVPVMGGSLCYGWAPLLQVDSRANSGTPRNKSSQSPSSK